MGILVLFSSKSQPYSVIANINITCITSRRGPALYQSKEKSPHHSNREDP